MPIPAGAVSSGGEAGVVLLGVVRTRCCARGIVALQRHFEIGARDGEIAELAESAVALAGGADVRASCAARMRAAGHGPCSRLARTWASLAVAIGY